MKAEICAEIARPWCGPGARAVPVGRAAPA